jgi:acetaldehyde dehydrogenase/alcohol dehydrogenase
MPSSDKNQWMQFSVAVLAAADAHIALAKLAVEKAGMDVMADKVIKNHIASECIYYKCKNEKTSELVAQDFGLGTMTTA